MKTFKKNDFKICIVGMGYVGLPLAARLVFKNFNVIGFDINEERLKELQKNNDINNDISSELLEVFTKDSLLTSDVQDIKECNIFIITVPTPINSDKTPDLSPIIDASNLIGSILKEGSIVIYESTVYPGVTDEICTPVLEKRSQLTHNINFSTGYSPERIVPGDKKNTIEKITKVVSASNSDALEIISFIYSSIIDAGIHIAPSIKVAEAAKVTENIQRDVNIALINEMHKLYKSLEIDTLEVIEAASTKWNFMRMTPGLVGGHCISIDPYYLMHKSKLSGFNPKLMNTARIINDTMSEWVFEEFLKYANDLNLDLKTIEVCFLGYSFKEDCNDIRNTKIIDLLLLAKDHDLNISLWDPIVSIEDLEDIKSKGIKIYKEAPEHLELFFLCVPHTPIKKFLKSHKGYIFDYRSF